MFDVYFIIDSIIVIAMLALASALVLKDWRSQLNRTFAYFIVAACGWILSNYLSNRLDLSYQTVLYATYGVFGFSYLSVLFVLKFAIELCEDAVASKQFNKYKIPLILFAILASSPLVTTGIHLQGKVYAVRFGPLIWVYALLLLGLLVMSGFVFWRNLRTTTGVLHRRIRAIWLVLVIFAPILVLVQFVLPAITGWFGLTNLGVFVMLGIVYGLYYGIAKHKLFNLQPVILRSMAYMLTLLILTGLYVGVTSWISARVAVHGNIWLNIVLNGVIILLVIISYQPLRVSLVRITGRVFYQNTYEPKILYTELNKILVSSVDLQLISHKATKLIADTLNLEYCGLLLTTATGEYRIIGNDTPLGLSRISESLHTQAAMSHKRLIITEHLAKTNQILKDNLDGFGISGLIRLDTNVKNEAKSYGYIVLGMKRTGYAINREDAQVMETVANELTIAIQNLLHYEEIQQFNATLQEKVEEQTRKYRMANEKLKKLDETKDEFISMASHQLRTPLTSVKGYLSMVLEGDAGKLNKQQEELLKQSFMSSQRMVNLIADLLNLSRLNTGKFVIDAQPTDLRVIVDQEVAQLRESAKAKGITLRWQMPPTFSMLNLDEGKIHQVVMNFIDNALYYTPEGGDIEVSLTETPRSIEYRVKDTGIGVPREIQRHLFSKFYRADNARRMRPDGTGLGIYMAKKVIAAQGGSVIFESEEGKGSTFGFRFSKTRASQPDPEQPQQA